MAIDNNIIQRIIDEADIVSVVGEYVKLEKKGGNFIGICPFHKDNNPSLSVSPSKKIFKCFSCNESGNVITFIQKYKNIDFLHAVKYVGNIVGINVDLGNDKKNESLEKLYKITKEATILYEFYLKNTVEGKKALEYLYNRNIDDEIIKYFHIGLSSNENMLEKSLVEEKGFLPIDLIKIGLLRANNDNKNYYDVFKGRIIFPLDDLYGNIVGFSGRIYEKNNKETKYLNSSDNDIFKKGSLLYNYSRSINEIKKKDQIFVFEGFMDVIAAYKANVLNSVATMGTALTLNQINIIKKSTKNIVLCYDGDTPGIEATKRAIKMFIKEQCNVKVVILPEGLDPDDYINKYGKESLNELLEHQSMDCIEYLYEIEKRNLIITDPTSVENFRKNVFSFLKIFNSETLVSQMNKRLSKELSIPVENLINDYNEFTVDNVENVPIEQNISERKTEKLKFIRAENELIYLAFFDKKMCIEISNKLNINEYVDRTNRNILFKLFDYYNLNDEMNKDNFYKALTDKEKERIEEILDPTNIYKINIIDDLVSVVCEYKYVRLKELKIEEIINKNEVTIEDLKIIAETKKNIIKRKKKKE